MTWLDKLREIITPTRWRVVTVLCFLGAILSLMLGSFLQGSALLVFGGIFLMASCVGHLIFWHCPHCGALMPTQMIASGANHCPYCGKAF